MSNTIIGSQHYINGLLFFISLEYKNTYNCIHCQTRQPLSDAIKHLKNV